MTPVHVQDADGATHVAPWELSIPMRDGVMLATDVYGAEGAEHPKPVLLERTPYGKRDSRDSDQAWHDRPVPQPQEIADFFTSAGFVVVRQDCRGRGGSDGEFVKYLNEAEDGSDTVEWLSRQPWCDGRVLMTGVSYSAHSQAAAATQGPSGLAAMFMDSGGYGSAYETGMRMGGAFEMKQVTWAFEHALASPEAAEDPVIHAALADTDLTDWLRVRPWSAGDTPLSVVPKYEEYLLDQWAHEAFDDYWTQPAIYSRGNYDRFPDCPVFNISSWYDPYVAAAVENFTELTRRHTSPVFLLLGPWCHGKRCRPWSGDADFGTGSCFDVEFGADYLSFRADWFSRAIANDLGGFWGGNRVAFFLMGGGDGGWTPEHRIQHGGEWHYAKTWPPEGSFPERFNLHPDGGLSSELPETEAVVSYQYDPAHPVPTIGGQVTSGEPVMSGGAYDQTPDADTFGAEPPYLPLGARPDVVVFRSAPLTQDLCCAGPVHVVLTVSSDCPDTDFTAKVIDEYPPSADHPHGFAMNVTEGILRARYRNSFESPELMEPGKKYRIEIQLPAVANRFTAGHRLRLDISSSDYPRFDVNPNTGGPVFRDRTHRIATNALHFGPATESSLYLQVFPATD